LDLVPNMDSMGTNALNVFQVMTFSKVTVIQRFRVARSTKQKICVPNAQLTLYWSATSAVMETASINSSKTQIQKLKNMPSRKI